MLSMTSLVAVSWQSIVVSVAIFLVFTVLAFGSRFVANRIVPILTARTKTKLDEWLAEALRMPVFVGILLLGLWFAVVRVPELTEYFEKIRTGFVIAAIFLTAWTVSRLLNALLRWYGTEVAVRTKTNLDKKLLPVITRTTNLVIFLVAATLALSEVGVNISPLVAGLGIGGLAVALALQPTLSNFLAGTYVISDGLIRTGHYVELDSGQSGFVEEIGWRTTKIRHWQGNMIIMPNSKLAEAIVTDYELPEPGMMFLANCGVSYSSDLKKVEEITLEVATKVMQSCPEGVKDFVPAFRYTDFSDSNVSFIVVLRAASRIGQFLVKHEFMKELHSRFEQEGIEIQYPARKIYFADGPFRMQSN